MSRNALAALTLAATVLAASGCGGGSSGSSSSKSSATAAGTTAASTTGAAVTPPPVTPVAVATGTPLTRAQLIAKANAICGRTNAKLAAMGFITVKEIERVFPQEVIYRTRETNELSKLVPPAGMVHTWSTLINDFHVYSAYSQAIVPYAHAHNLHGALPLVSPTEKAEARLHSDAAHAGIARCALNT